MRNWLIDLRKSLNLTQQDVSEKTSVTRQMIAAIENETANPSVETARQIAMVLNISWTMFFENDHKQDCHSNHYQYYTTKGGESECIKTVQTSTKRLEKSRVSRKKR